MWLGELTVPPRPLMLTWDENQQNKQTNNKMIGITVFSARMIIFSTIKRF